MTEQNVLLEDTRPGAGSGGTAAEMQATKYLICLSDGLRYGLDAEQVVEIITDHTITPLPCVPGYVQGVINLRGQIIPIIDIRLRLGKPQAEESCIIVVNIGSDCMGILVDGVDQMLDIPKENIHPLPANSTQMLVSGMCSLPDGSGTMMVLDCEQLAPHD